MTMGFSDLNVSTKTADLLKRHGIVKPMPVQEQVIPAIFSGKDVIARAQTGTGKTLAFLIPLIEKIVPERKFPQGLIIVPTRELAQQVAVEAKKIIGDRDITVASISGGRDIERQVNKVKNAAQILIGTTGRLLDHVKLGHAKLNGVNYLVLDEVDEMLEQGFIDEAAKLIALTNNERQTILCSATLSEEVKKLGQRLTRNCAIIDIDPEQITVKAIKQICIKTTDDYKQKALDTLVKRLNPYLMIIFCFSKERAVELTDWLLDQKYNVDCLHGDLSQAKRKTVMKAFRDAKLQLLVATDLAARGLDIEGVTHIINYDIPHDPDWYVHRVGRTGRAGNTGIAITLYTAEESKWLKKIEEKLSLTMEKQNLDGAIIKRRVNDKSVKRMKTVSKTTDKRKVKTTKPAQRRLGSSAKTKQRKSK